MPRHPRFAGPVLALGLAALLAASAPAAEVGVGSLLREMVDLERLALFPDPPYTARQASSHDRASKTPLEGEAWFANADQGKYLREEENVPGRKEHVMLDAEGPGALVRIWSADPKGILRIYLDGSSRPALEAPMADLLTGKVPPFLPPLAGERGRGANLYFPIPYRTRCKVTSDASPFYYHVNYRTYPPGTAVESFSLEALKGMEKAMLRVREVLASPSTARFSGRVADCALFAVGVPAGEARLLWKGERGGAVREVRLSLGRSVSPAALRKCILVGRFDGEQRPSVWAPLGDFFGSAPGINPYSSLPLEVLPTGEMVSRWVMPFEREARFEIRNLSDEEVTARGSFSTGPFQWSDRALHFHARFRSEADMATRPFRDWSLVECSGQGVFVGDALAVANPVKAWWGEGDEKIYVDGESFPSHFGTGTEDYYGYASCSNQPFQHAYHNQPRCDGPANFGHTSVNRWHILDPIPFSRSFRFDLELWHGNASARVSYAATSYWYARPGSTHSLRDLLPAELAVPALPELKVVRVEGALEAEGLRVLARTSGSVEPQDMEAFDGPWSGGGQLCWRDGKPGDELKLEFSAPQAGRYRVSAGFTLAVDHGLHQLSINGAPAGEPLDLFHRGVVHSGQKELGVFDLRSGPNELGVRVAGTNPEAEPKRYMFGLDYLLLRPEGQS